MNINTIENKCLHNNLILKCLVFLAAALALAPVLFNGFVDWDDMQYVVMNPALRGSWLDALLFSPGYYHPLITLTYKLEFTMFGLNPFPYHLTNFLLHLANCFTIFVLFKKIGLKAAAAYFGALVFLLHPIHIEPVAWISGRKDLLSGLFFLCSLYHYINYIRTGSRYPAAYSLLLYACALLSKPTVLFLPAVLLLIDLYFSRSFTLKLLMEKAVFTVAGISIFFLSSAPSGFLLDPAGKIFRPMAILSGITNSAVFYICKFIIPVKLSALYPDFTKPESYIAWITLAAAIAIAGSALVSLIKNRHDGQFRFSVCSALSFGICFFLITALPNLLVSPPADRYIYLADAGFCLILASLAGSLSGIEKLRYPVFAVILAYLVLISAASHVRASIWKNSFTLWSDVMAKNTKEPLAYYGLGNAYKAEKQFDKAMGNFNRCIELNPDYWKAYNNRARLKGEMNRQREALADYSQAIRLNPEEPLLLLNRGNAYFALADFTASIKDYKEALTIAPYLTQAKENLLLAEKKKRRQ